MYTAISIVRDKLHERRDQLLTAKAKELELLDKLCSQRSATKSLEFHIAEIEVELKNLEGQYYGKKSELSGMDTCNSKNLSPAPVMTGEKGVIRDGN